jgi:hypothetical protein
LAGAFIARQLLTRPAYRLRVDRWLLHARVPTRWIVAPNSPARSPP